MAIIERSTQKVCDIAPRIVEELCNKKSTGNQFNEEKNLYLPTTVPEFAKSRQFQKLIYESDQEEQEIKKINIQNRRYLGNKYRLLPFIEEIIKDQCHDVHSLFDVFAGTGIVAYHFMDKMKVYTNDLLFSNYITHLAFMGNNPVDEIKINKILEMYNSMDPEGISDNYMSENFHDTYFSENDCKKIGYIRESIESMFVLGQISLREKAVLITSLLYGMDKIANTCGHYDAYRKGVLYNKHLMLYPINLEKKSYTQNVLMNGDSNEIVKRKRFPFIDCVYCDPPYNSRNYSDLYHVLENVARWQKPEVFGVARKMDRSSIKSRYCSKSAADAFRDLVDSLKCRYIILSYNNTGKSANARSNARMSDEDILNILSTKGKVDIFSRKYRAFTTGKSSNDQNEERLFFCHVK